MSTVMWSKACSVENLLPPYLILKFTKKFSLLFFVFFTSACNSQSIFRAVMYQNVMRIILCLVSYFTFIHQVLSEDASSRLHWMLFKSGDGKYHTYRIPALVKT